MLEAIYLLQEDPPEGRAHSLIPKSKQHQFSGDVSITAHLEFDPSELKKIEEHINEVENLSIKITKISDLQVTKKYKFKDSSPTTEGNWIESLLETISIKGKIVGSKNQNEEDLKKYIGEDKYSIIENFCKEMPRPQILYYPDFLFKFPEKIYLEEHNTEEMNKRSIEVSFKIFWIQLMTEVSFQ